jgi:hypothetical protein
MAVTPFSSHSSDDVLNGEGASMKTSADVRERTGSELATLSRDPALTFRPDPAFRAKFRNADEIIEGDFNGVDIGPRPVALTPVRWAGAASWRRSPKD